MAARSRRGKLRARVLGALFGLLYRNRYLYWFASTVPFAGQWRIWQRLVLPRIRGTRVLEIGCGPGKLLADMVRAGYICAAVDRSPQMVAAARDELRRQGLAEREAPISLTDVQHLPYLGASFDTVVSTFPTEYIYEPASLREVARVLRPGGRLVVVMGAGLLPTRLALWPLVALQRLVYGPSAPVAGRGCALVAQTAPLPLAMAGLIGKPDCVRGPFWEAYLIVAEKPTDVADRPTADDLPQSVTQ
ncbi:MAG TPA: class I SAM-dependent methyltransferase [Ktedonobacterales bacterium]|nr:class I SAM-dependent methyltransferase [Ktedonobacterales bacterium]